MRNKRSAVFIAVLSAVSLVACHEHPVFAQEATAKIAGKWQMSMDTPHGAVQGDLEVKQDGSKIAGTYTVEHVGAMAITGNVEGTKVSLNLAVPGGEMTMAFSGTVDGDKMSGSTQMGGGWKAARQ